MLQLRREPFRLLFPLGALLALLGVLPWLLFGTGLSRLWLGTYHALTMTQAFLVAIAAGFLGTMLPRRTGSAPLSAAELLALAVALIAIPVALFRDRLALAEVAYLVAVATLAQFALRRIGGAKRRVPSSFVHIPFALVAGTIGAALLLAATRRAPSWTLAVGRALVEEGVLLPLVMALVPMLTPIILDGQAPGDEPRQARLQAALGALFLGSFAVQATWPRLALGTRGLVLTVALFVVMTPLRRPRLPGLHRRVYQLALLLLPVGLLAATLTPAYRVPLQHLTFIGGLSLLVFAVGAHVTFMHTGRDALARRRPWPIAVVAALTVAAALTRASAERVP
ncbi:MAG TPA: NnrS family protein, partial [Polyangia bacterium]|nr:NnrS family protein [Polyangia bacterium]